MSFTDKVIKSSSVPVHVIRCKDIHGRECHYVLMCSNIKLQNILNSQEDISDLNEEGHIIASGFGYNIPPETKAMLKEKYGFDADSLK